MPPDGNLERSPLEFDGPPMGVYPITVQSFIDNITNSEMPVHSFGEVLADDGLVYSPKKRTREQVREEEEGRSENIEQDQLDKTKSSDNTDTLLFQPKKPRLDSSNSRPHIG